jgi:hypothetical protein
VEDGVIGSREVREAVHLVQEKVVARLSDAEQKECRRWVLDTGATNHMTGCKSAFSDLDRAIHGADRGNEHRLVQRQERRTPSVHRCLLHSPADHEHHQCGSARRDGVQDSDRR